MCGIWGIFPDDTKGFFESDMEGFERAMILTSVRGSHSTGIALVANAKERPKIVKTLGGPAFLLNTDAWTKIAEFAVKKAKIAFGHGRYATKGEITEKNAHPFVHEHITLVHNGTIHFGLTEHAKEVDTDVDSHALCVAIAKKGLIPALEDVSGAYALIVHDAKEGCIYVVRNEDRPLHRVKVFGKTYIMSAYDATKYLAGLQGNTNAQVEYFPKHLIFKYDIAKADWTSDDTLVKAMEKKSLYHQTPWAGTTHYSIGGKSHTGKARSGISESTYYCPLELLCTKFEEVPNSKQWRYIFSDDAGIEYSALSSSKQPERVGNLCKIDKHTKITDRSTGEIVRFVKFRELKWDEETQEDKTQKAIDEVNSETVTTFNRHILSKRRWLELIARNDCAICDGPIMSGEAENTIKMHTEGLICGECIRQGKHFAYGFGQ